MLRPFPFAVIALFVLSACLPALSPYDAVIDTGLGQYRETLNSQVLTMASKAGTPQGTHEANLGTYNALSAKAGALYQRARLNATGKGCRLPEKLNARLTRLFQAEVPTLVQPAAQRDVGDTDDCTELLLKLVHDQLVALETIHRDTDKCADSGGVQISCLRRTSADSALKISNQSIDAAWTVELAKKRGE